MSTTAHIWNARDLVCRAGRTPAAALAVAIGVAGFTGVAHAQNDGVRNPMKDGGESKVTVSEHMTVDLHVKDEALADVLELLSIQSERNIVISKNVSAKVTASLYGVTFYEALDAILHVNGFGYIEQGNFIYVYTLEEIQKIQEATRTRIAKTIDLNYINGEDAKHFIEDLLSEDGTIKTYAAADAFSISDDAPVGKDDYALAAKIVVNDYEENVEAVEKLLKQIDTKPQQVLVEAMILQTSINEETAFGVDFSIIGDLHFTDFINIGGPLNATNALIQGGDGSSGGLTPTDNQAFSGTSSPGNTGGKATMKFGIIQDDLAIFVRALDEVTDTTVLSRPNILTLNRQPARVLVGQKVGYLSSTTTDTATTQSVEFLDTGTQLYIRPFVSSDGTIRMELKPKVSEATIRQTTDSSGASVAIPDETTQEVTTNVAVRSGQTIVLGGLFKEATVNTRRQVPILGDIPLVGTAFRGHDDQVTRSEVMFLITPKLVDDMLIDTSSMDAMAMIDAARTGARQGLLPFSRERQTGARNMRAEKLAREGKYEQALWQISRSLAMNSHQPELIRLREHIMQEKEEWPTQEMLHRSLANEFAQVQEEVGLPDEQPSKNLPAGWADVPTRKTSDHFEKVAAARAEAERLAAEEAARIAAEQAAAEEAARAAEQAAAEQEASASEEQFAAENTADDQTFDAQDGYETGANQSTEPLPTEFEAESDAEVAEVETGPQSSTFESGEQPAAETTGKQESIQAVQWMLSSLREQVQAYRDEHGRYPVLATNDGGNSWDELVSEGFIDEAPVNHWVGGEQASTVVISSQPDGVAHNDYGWVYDQSTGRLWAAGFTADDQPIQGDNAFAELTESDGVAELGAPWLADFRFQLKDIIGDDTAELIEEDQISGVETDGN